WQSWFDQPAELAQARELVDDTRTLLQDIPEKTKVAQQQILEIIMAQDFQDLTGQVISRMLGVVNAIETELIQVLISHLPEEEREAKRKEIDQLLNGPQIKPDEKPEVVSNQDQVDDLLSSLGF
ncbi:MAG TPA: protein phosphatase CheZ, partial [Pusillimonas sp.]|nr:protein phosphatase CheZ [Pusillimonas sp.]